MMKNGMAHVVAIAVLTSSLLGCSTFSLSAAEDTKLSATVQVAETDRHWAFQPVQLPDIPEVSDFAWPSNPIDRFVLAQLKASGLTHSSKANRHALIRRVYIDLIGLTPTREEVVSFIRDKTPDAFLTVVDDLLSRPEYGERWGRHWLDVARYADAKGYVDAGEVKYPFAYTYRDYVVNAFNRDLPFDRFVLEQLAADRISDNLDSPSLAALGFITVGSRFNFFPHDIIDDRIDLVTRGFLGLSVGCARCHDHKYDPISTEDYYTMYGIFANTMEPTPDQSDPLGESGPSEDAVFLKNLKEESEKYRKLREDLHQKVMHEMRGWCGDYLRFVVRSSEEHQTEEQPKYRTERGLVRVVSAYSKGGMVRWRRFLQTREKNDPVLGLWKRLFDLSQEELPEKFESVFTAFKNSGHANSMLLDSFRDKEVSSMMDVANIYADLLEAVDEQWREVGGGKSSIQRFEDVDLEQLRQVLYGPESPGTVTLDESENLYLLDESVAVRKHFADIERVYLKSWKGVAPRPMRVVDRPSPLEQHVFVRGNPQRLGKLVKRRIPSVLGGKGSDAIQTVSGRLELARAIAHPENPLTSRVIVNRVWKWHFGRGLVDTAGDFGFRGGAPTHPKLLDYLANWFVESGWSFKKLHRLILMSITWRQNSQDRNHCLEMDPDNRNLWRMNRRRLDFETLRDSLLRVSGLLETSRGGPPIQKRPDDISNRTRTLYTYIDRESLNELYQVFDFPSPDITSSGRSETTVPQQSLFLLNSPFVIHQAEQVCRLLGLAGYVEEDFSDPSLLRQIRKLYHRVYSREPEPDEIETVRRFLEVSSLDPPQTEKMPDSYNPWIDLAHAMLVSNEFLFVD